MESIYFLLGLIAITCFIIKIASKKEREENWAEHEARLNENEKHTVLSHANDCNGDIKANPIYNEVHDTSEQLLSDYTNQPISLNETVNIVQQNVIPDLASDVESTLRINSLIYKLFQKDNGIVFMVGILAKNSPILLEIIIDNLERDSYSIKCKSLNVCLSKDSAIYNHAIDSFNMNSELIKCYIDTNTNELFFILTRSDESTYSESQFVNDFNSIVNACDINTIEIKDSGFKNKIFDKDFTFLQDLINITYSARYYNNIPNILNLTQDIVNSITNELNLNEKLEKFRNLPDDVTIMPCYPTSLEDKIRHIKCLLQAMIKLDSIAINHNIKPVNNDVLFQTMHNMGLAQDIREHIIKDILNTQNISEEYKDRMLQSILFMSNDDNRAMMLFNQIRLLNDDWYS